MVRNLESPSKICQRLINFIQSLLIKPPAGSSHQVPIEEGNSPINRATNDNGYTSSEILVEFRHTNPVNRKKGNNDHFTRKIDWKSGDEAQGIERKNVAIEGSARKKDDHPQNEDGKPRPPILSVDINERFDAYIESRKKAMIRNYSNIDHENS